MLRVKLRSIVIAQILVLFVLSGCAQLGVPEGWPAGVVNGDSLYIGTQDGDLRALDIESGEIVWTFEFLGDADTQACIAGALAEAFYMNVPEQIKEFVLTRIFIAFKRSI